MLPKKLLKECTKIMDQLIKSGIIRTQNNPVSDYAEWLVAKNLKLELMPPSQNGYDAIDKKSRIRYEIKSRRNDKDKIKNQIGILRSLKSFTFLIIVIFDHYFNLSKVYQIPNNIVKKYAKLSAHQNGYILRLNSGILNDKLTKNITKKFKKFY